MTSAILKKVNLIGEPELRELLAREFPELEEELAENAGLVHLYMGALRRFVEECAAASSRRGRAIAALTFLEGLAAAGTLHPDVENAVYVSFLEDIELPPNLLLPARLSEMQKEMEEHNRRLQ